MISNGQLLSDKALKLCSNMGTKLLFLFVENKELTYLSMSYFYFHMDNHGDQIGNADMKFMHC